MGHVELMGETRNVYRKLVGEAEEKRPLERPRHEWENYNKIDLGEIGWVGTVWFDLALDRDQCRALVNTVMNLRVL
jgi:hypothetical protein